MGEEAKLFCMGILKGLYRFEKEASTEFQDLAIDSPHEYFRQTLEDWTKGIRDSKRIEDMDKFVKKIARSGINSTGRLIGRIYAEGS